MGMTGLRYITGDFNQIDGQLLQPELWRKLGWKEVQGLGQEFSNRQPVPTCKSKTIKDFIWISPELAEYFESVATLDDLFPDHAVLYARFKPWSRPESIPFWRKPRPINWKKMPSSLPTTSSNPICTNADDEIVRIASEFEQRANLASFETTGSIAQKGRSKTTGTVEKRSYTKPLSKSREGDAVPSFFGISLQHTRWFRQLRRLEAYKRIPEDNKTLQQKIQQDRVWRSILKAPGFPFGFRKWWNSSVAPFAATPTDIPLDAPSQSTAILVCDIFELYVKQLEQTLIHELTQKAVHNRANNPNKIFEDIRKPTTCPVQTLADTQEDVVVMIDESNLILSFEQEVPFVRQQPLLHENGSCRILNIEGNNVTVDNINNVVVGSKLKQETFEASLPKLFQKFADEWT